MTGIVRFPRTIPSTDDPIGWARLFRALNEVLTQDASQYALNSETTLSNRDGIAIQTVLQYVGDAGRASTQRLMPLINWANAGSLQSAIPISASADASVATVNVDAHSVLYGGETISYNAGSIIGLPVSTVVYIYVDDPTAAGGAVTYEYTTDYTDVVGAQGRYFVGAILTPVSSVSAAVSAVTNANPCEVSTGTAHSFSTGDVVDFDGVGGTTELNAGTYTITVVDADTFTLNGVDATTFGVYTSGGTVTRVSTPADGLGGAGGGTEYYDPGFYY